MIKTIQNNSKSLKLSYYLPFEERKIGAAAETSHFFLNVVRKCEVAARSFTRPGGSRRYGRRSAVG